MAIHLVPFEHDYSEGASIKVVGVGGGGGNILNSMIDKGIEGVDFIAVNTDLQALNKNKAGMKIQIGKSVTKGLGAGMDEKLGQKSAEESREEIEKALKGSDMIFLTAGMGGGTGTGAAPIIAHIAKTLGALVVAIVTKPFDFEAEMKMQLALSGIKKLKPQVDSLIIIPNQRILTLIDPQTTRKQAFDIANKVLYNATKGISQIITTPGENNVDFADVRTIMRDMGEAIIGLGVAEGEDRAEKAAMEALSNPVLEDIDIQGSKNVLVNIIGSENLRMSEIEKINNIINKAAGDKARYIIGWGDDENLKNEVVVTVIATGFKKKAEEESITERMMDEDVIKHKQAIKIGEQREIKITKPERKIKIDRMPIDDDELRQYDSPAYKRHNLDILNEDMSEKQEEEKIQEEEDFSFKDFSLDDELSKPTFLRKVQGES
ncbi:MAG: cell division protein FtsZ [Ignavibacteria bacterium]|nr:cell division protein FtsZ [Ignavibacteria bacterium]